MNCMFCRLFVQCSLTCSIIICSIAVGFVSSFDFLPREESGTLVQLGEVEDSETARRM